jgi:hypothetical protein
MALRLTRAADFNPFGARDKRARPRANENRRSHFRRNAASRLPKRLERVKGIEPSSSAWKSAENSFVSTAIPTNRAVPAHWEVFQISVCRNGGDQPINLPRRAVDLITTAAGLVGSPSIRPRPAGHARAADDDTAIGRDCT